MPKIYPENIVLQGGGAKGPAEVFAYLELVNQGAVDPQKIKAYAGTSAGAISGCLFAFGKTPKEALELMQHTNFKTFLDGKSLTWLLKRSQEGLKWYKALPDAIRARQAYKKLMKDQGLCTGDVFRAWIDAQIHELVKGTALEGKRNITFADLHHLVQVQPLAQRHFADLKVIGSNVNRQQTETFSFENTPNMCIADAVRISMSLPFVYKPWHRFDVDARGERFQVNDDAYVDGGMHTEDNYPINAFDQHGVLNPKTIGLCLLSPDLYADAELRDGEGHRNITTPEDYFSAVAAMAQESQGSDRGFNHAQLWRDPRSVRISTDTIGTLQFDLSKEDYGLMQAHAQIAVQDYLERLNKAPMESQLSDHAQKIKPETSALQAEKERLAVENRHLREQMEMMQRALEQAKAMAGSVTTVPHRPAVAPIRPMLASFWTKSHSVQPEALAIAVNA